MADFPASDNLNAYMISESGRITNSMYVKSRARNKHWLSLIKRGKFPLGMNSVLSNTIAERTTTDTSFTWNNLDINDGGPNNANPAAVNLGQGYTLQTFRLAYGAVNSTAISLHDANLVHNFPKQLDAKITNMENEVMDITEDRYQDEYIRLAGHKIIANSSVPETGSDQAWAATAPTSTLTIELLEYCYDRMMRDGGQDGLDYMFEEPCPYVMCSPEFYRSLKRSSTVFREDWRYSTSGKGGESSLLNPLKTDGAYGHFKFRLNWRAPRYDLVGGEWVRRPFYDTTAATIGNKADPGTLYRNARYEDTSVIHPMVMTMLTYDPEFNFDHGVKFDPASFLGRFKWINNKDNVWNVDGHVGYFRALLANAAEPGLTNLGYVIRAKRCTGDFGLISCSQ